MAKDVKFIISANASRAEAEIRKLQTTGSTVSDSLSRSFEAMGIRSSVAIEKERATSVAAYERIKASGVASAQEIGRAKAALAVKTSDLDKELKGVKVSSDSLGGSFSLLQTAISGVIAGFGISELVQARIEIDKITNGLAAVSGANAGADYGFVRGEVDRLGLSLKETAKGFVSLSASSKGTSLEGEQTRKIFSAVAGASTVLGLSADDTSGILRALSQMMSKGTVQSEELKGQLGERLPGAFNLAAKAMGLTTAELQKHLEAGTVLATDLLPKLAAELEKTYGAQVQNAAKSTQAELNRLSTAMFDLKAKAAEGDTFADFFRGATATTEVVGDNLDVVKAALVAVTASSVISGLGALAAKIKAVGAAGAVAQAGLFGMAAAAGYAAGKGIDVGVYKATGYDISGNNEYEASQKRLTEATKRFNEVSELERQANIAQTTEKEKAVVASNKQAEATKTVSASLSEYSKAVEKLGSLQLKAAASGFAEDLKQQAVYLKANNTLAANMSAPIQQYMNVIDDAYGRQLDLQKQIGQALFKTGADQRTIAQQSITIAQTEKAAAETRLGAWTQYYDSLRALHSTTMADMAKSQTELMNIRMTTGDLVSQVQQKMMTPMQQYYAQVGQLEQKQQMAQQLSSDEKIKMLQQVQQSWAGLSNEIKDGDNVLLTQAKAAATAINNITTIGTQLEAEKAAQITKQQETITSLQATMTSAASMITEYQTKVTELDGTIAALTRTFSLTLKDEASGTIKAIKSELDQLRDKTITVSVQYQQVSGGSSETAPMGSFASGTDYVPATGLYLLHRGEEVKNTARVTAESKTTNNAASYNFSGNIVLPNVTNQTTARELFTEFQKLARRQAA